MSDPDVMETPFDFGLEDGVLRSTLVFQDEHRKHNSRPVGGDGMFECFQGAHKQVWAVFLQCQVYQNFHFSLFGKVITFLSLVK